jgi:N utilization substance protein A
MTKASSPATCMEEPLDFAVFGRAAVQAAKQRIIQRVREASAPRSATSSRTRVGDLLSGEVQQIERGKLVVMLNKFREAEAIIPYREQNHREHFTRASRFAPCSSASRRRPRARGSF